MASPITFGGLASGLDTNAIVDKLVQVERQPILRLQKQRQDQQTRKGLYSDLTTKINALATSLNGLKTQTGVQGRVAELPTGAPLSAEVQGAAPTGTYSIVVSQLAQAQRTYSNTFAGADTAGIVAAGNITFTIGASSATVSLDATDTLNTAAQKINATGLRLSASVIYDGTNYRLVVNGRDTGAANAIAITDTGTGLGLTVPANTVVTAKNAQLTVDGLAISSATNAVSGSIPGVTLTLKSTSATPTTLSVSENPDQLKTALKGIAEAYNAAMGVLTKQLPSDGKTQLGADTLAGDSTARQLQSTLLSLTTLTGGPAGNAFTTLAEIGLSVDRYGTMTLNEDRLQKALASNSAAVANLLAGTTGTDGLMQKISDKLKLYTDFVDGALQVKQKSIDLQIKSLDDDIARMETAATAYEQRIREQFLQMEQLIAQFQSQTSALSQIVLTPNSGASR